LKKAYAGAPCFISAINKYPLDLWETAPEVFGKVVESYVWWRLSMQFEKVSFWRRRQEEVDFIIHNSKGVEIPIEVKFTSRIRSNDLKVLVRYMGRRGLCQGYVLTRDRIDEFTVDGKQLRLIPYYMLA
jgi:predicted AAA+ superfamily ATPase